MNFNNNNNNNNTVIIIMSSKLQILMYGAGADPIWSEPESAPGLLDSEPPKKVAAPQRCYRTDPWPYDWIKPHLNEAHTISSEGIQKVSVGNKSLRSIILGHLTKQAKS